MGVGIKFSYSFFLSHQVHQRTRGKFPGASRDIPSVPPPLRGHRGYVLVGAGKFLGGRLGGVYPSSGQKNGVFELLSPSSLQWSHFQIILRQHFFRRFFGVAPHRPKTPNDQVILTIFLTKGSHQFKQRTRGKFQAPKQGFAPGATIRKKTVCLRNLNNFGFAT